VTYRSFRVWYFYYIANKNKKQDYMMFDQYKWISFIETGDKMEPSKTKTNKEGGFL